MSSWGDYRRIYDDWLRDDHKRGSFNFGELNGYNISTNANVSITEDIRES